MTGWTRRSGAILTALALSATLAGLRSPAQEPKPEVGAPASGSTRMLIVAPDGDDEHGRGTIERPFRTLLRASVIAAPGTHLLLRGGTYSTAGDAITASGTRSAPIVVQPYGGEEVTFSGKGREMRRFESLLAVREARHVIVRGLTFEDSPRRGLSVSESEHVTLEANVLRRIHTRGIGGGGDHIVVRENTLEQTVLENRNGAVGDDGWAAAISIWRRASGRPSRNWTVEGNTIRESWGEGVVVLLVEGALIEGNTIHDTFGPNIYLDHCRNVEVSGNYLYATDPTFYREGRDYPAHGIGLANEQEPDPLDPSTERITIVDNVMAGVGRGINFWDDDRNRSPSNTYRDVVIAHNLIYAPQHIAIHFDPVCDLCRAPQNVVLHANIVHAAPEGTLEIGDPAAWRVTDNVFPDGIPSAALDPGNSQIDVRYGSPVIGGAKTGFRPLVSLPEARPLASPSGSSSGGARSRDDLRPGPSFSDRPPR